ncbi:hypothetical protein C0Q70_18595 [Pomacea canaliculata]|uniref:Uncharacterized protein n=1 Tax=Pomacea canaliculata TaxID=400727 RepID=A0A2T7NGZ4_POMCA|nr:hypothetical protein C0Q70_18595 [Pomacea canaliculata]
MQSVATSTPSRVALKLSVWPSEEAFSPGYEASRQTPHSMERPNQAFIQIEDLTITTEANTCCMGVEQRRRCTSKPRHQEVYLCRVQQ